MYVATFETMIVSSESSLASLGTYTLAKTTFFSFSETAWIIAK